MPKRKGYIHVETRQVYVGSRAGSESSARVLHQETWVKDFHRSANGRCTLDRVEGERCRNNDRLVRAAQPHSWTDARCCIRGGSRTGDVPRTPSQRTQVQPATKN